MERSGREGKGAHSLSKPKKEEGDRARRRVECLWVTIRPSLPSLPRFLVGNEVWRGLFLAESVMNVHGSTKFSRPFPVSGG